MNQVYIANLAQYNNGRLVGEWVELPCEDLDARLKKIVGNDEEWAIHDYELPFEVEEYENVHDLNDFFTTFDDLDEMGQVKVLAMIEQGYDRSEALEQYEDCYIYVANNMTEVAEQIVDEQGLLSSMPEDLRYYFDYEAYGRDLDCNGNFVEVELNDTNYIVEIT